MTKLISVDDNLLDDKLYYFWRGLRYDAPPVDIFFNLVLLILLLLTWHRFKKCCKIPFRGNLNCCSVAKIMKKSRIAVMMFFKVLRTGVCLFPKDIILMAIRWYIAYPLSYHHVEELIEERGLEFDHA